MGDDVISDDGESKRMDGDDGYIGEDGGVITGTGQDFCFKF
jgi:hypothetical protein